ncbi:protein DD3-3-like [Hydractinia symbiolongicarpus]|uniref:protein DD3-3-like n=1 Tax=Hydractinia symbiolongicarpus TaxID=13093 RepID=UPI00255167BE|nr:protein DD3-3-like [Hydractinia symbiolongicarpus]
MSNLVKVLGLLLACIVLTFCDVYMHSPRGSNNRLNEKSANRKTNNRLFDSQNNNRGGYNVGDKTSNAAKNEANQYRMVYFQSSKNAKNGKGVSNLGIEWTNQHGCGGNENDNPNKLNCHIVLQYICEPTTGSDAITVENYKMRDGTNSDRQNYQPPQNNERKEVFESRKRNNVRQVKGYQEPFEWYDKCSVRERNKGIFTADQKVGNNAKNTRQNPNGNRNGYECPEERDYYPYWHPSDWKDIGILAENESMCEYFQSESFNVKPKGECVENWPNTNIPKHYSKYNNKADCENNKGVWKEFHSFLEKAKAYETKTKCEAQNQKATNQAQKVAYVWALPIYGKKEECLVKLDKPFCKASPFSRDNHLGNGVDLEQLAVNWELPYFPSSVEQRCVLRLRYNISTDDYDPYFTNSSQNQDYGAGVQSPVQQNPAVDIGAQNVPMRLAINTAQYGRTFQDRSHVFLLRPRPKGAAAGNLDSVTINNLHVRGKRGNIVQVYPAVEYDFFPTNLEMKEEELVHIQWTGSNTHNNQAPGGDGQTGDDGQGQGGTDRNNMLGLKDRNDNYPATMEDPDSIFNNVKSVKWQALGTAKVGALTASDKKDIAVQFATSGYYQCVESTKCPKSVQTTGQMNNLLNNAPASFGGMLLQFNAGTFHYMCTRNNNFSNRSQKGTLIVKN